MCDDTRRELADLLYADLMVSGARTVGEARTALMESVRSLQNPVVVEVGEVTEADKAARRSPTFIVRMPRLPGER